MAKADLAADIALDRLRPSFRLTILTMPAVGATTRVATATQIAAGMGIAIRPDGEPERNLVSRADHWPFLKIGVPATKFVFGDDPGIDAEARHRAWYRVRDHRPQDDMAQPRDAAAAPTFNHFFDALTAASPTTRRDRRSSRGARSRSRRRAILPEADRAP